jgi:hypothetical protein
MEIWPETALFLPVGKWLALKQNNLMMFVLMAEGIDDDTWLYHLEETIIKIGHSIA